ncbi:response regulator transcription factor [Selenomonas caprae]|uniref:Two-component system, OmpR family, alkaline phosphatase synthesis response regulator PhoP n=2 Tax=Selenomonas TaxID=970 RepID=A0A1I3GZH7_SELRU|nr:response regulator transcription factor [Selenomonas caprae]SFI28988.1 two-component system, OmpR family, alkaline phosphatase synthesis response regulator PhoP [Selenomonas ruminantium]SFT38585.1 two-component system, OmpR family, alkaline phosphatase synthesis response regulator PhoP [Selenomonas ruminantium]
MKVLAVDDEQSIRELLAFQLQKHGYEALMAEDGQEALAKAEGMDLILLDLMLPGLDGLEVCRRLKADKRTARIPIIMLTAKAEEIDKVLGLELGADDYVVKPFSVRELMARVKAVLRRSSQEGPQEETLQIDCLRLDFSSYQAWLAGEELVLTPKEFELLKLLVTSPGRAFSRDELLERIWGYEYYGDTRTVDVHIRHLRAKLGERPGLSERIETVRGVGYRFARC